MYSFFLRECARKRNFEGTVSLFCMSMKWEAAFKIKPENVSNSNGNGSTGESIVFLLNFIKKSNWPLYFYEFEFNFNTL